MATMFRIGSLAVFFSIMAMQYMPTFVTGDAALISKLCGNTERPDYCLYCFNTENKGSDKMTPRDLGLTIIAGCVGKQSTVVRKRFIEYINRPQIDPKFREKCISCERYIQVLETNMTSAFENFINGRLQEAVHRAELVFNNFETCNNIIGDDIPLSFLGQFDRLEAYCRITPQVLKQL